MKKILILNDFVSNGRIGGLQVNTILTYKNFDVYFLPTALISNMFTMGDIEISDTTSFVENTLNLWAKSKINFDAIFIGYIKNSSQKNMIIDFIKNLSYKPLIINDPIMADNGFLYKGLCSDIIDIHRDLLEISDILIPNFTEAKILSSNDYNDPIDIIKNISSHKRKAIITSYMDKKGSRIIAYDKKNIKEFFYEHIDKSFYGTGDIFDGIFLSNYLNSCDFFSSVLKTKKSMSKILRKKMSVDPDTNDINIERYLDLI